ncbi:MAG: YgiQ family radical SAM protein [Deltaproteobacteria bacterium HGW-Deltaproteobacteria-22]|nr:MAG: YgiQ family radical SAM protein [Deltaproteobacteria bacterium HGW-Deltaproteobacteria-22]
MKFESLIAQTNDLVDSGLIPDLRSFSSEGEYLDVILISGDALVDHPSFGTAMVARYLESLGLRVGVIAQPDWRDPGAVKILGRPRLYFGVSSGNLDSMLHHYTAARKKRHDDPYSPGGVAGLRPNRAVIVYSGLVRAAYRDVPLVIGGMEASLRRLAHYDYWDDRIRRGIILDARADVLVYGNAERALAAITTALRQGRDLDGLEVAGTVVVRAQPPAGEHLKLPSFEDVESDPRAFAVMTRDVHREIASPNPRTMVQLHGGRFLWHLPPAAPLGTAELDALYRLPFTRRAHPMYRDQRIPALDTVRHSITTHRGCFGGCTFCALAVHQGLVITSRSPESITLEAEEMSRARDFGGTITDVGGPSANMYGASCGRNPGGRGCMRASCLVPRICPDLQAGAGASIRLWSELMRLPHVKHVFVASGVRFDLANRDPEYIRLLVQNHTGGHLKVAPEHISDEVLGLMRKPAHREFERFLSWFEKFRPPKVYLVPYMMSSHPGCTDRDMAAAAGYLQDRKLAVDQVQDFIPIPGTVAAAMYHSGLDPERLTPVFVEKTDAGKLRQRHALDRKGPLNVGGVKKWAGRSGQKKR